MNLPRIALHRICGLNEDENVIHRGIYQMVQKVYLENTHMVLRTFRQNSEKLWDGLFASVGELCSHPGFVRNVAVVVAENGKEAALRNVGVLQEYVPNSLYGCLHEKGISLSIGQILDTICQVVQMLNTLHVDGAVMGNLSSKKVLLEGEKVRLLGYGTMNLYKAAGIENRHTIYVPSVKCTGMQHDIFSVGVLLYEMATGTTPNDTMFTTLSKVGRKHVDLEILVKQCLDIESNHQPNAQKLLGQLNRLRNSVQTQPHPGGILVNQYIENTIDQAKQTAVKSESKSLLLQLSKSTRQLSIAETSLLAEQSKVDDMNASLGVAEKSRQQLNSEINNLSTKITQLQNQLEIVQAEAHVAREEKLQGDDSLAIANQNLSVAQHQVSILKKKVRHLELDKQQGESQALSLKSTMKSMTDKGEDLTQLLDASKQDTRLEQENRMELDVRWNQAIVRLRSEVEAHTVTKHESSVLRKKNKELENINKQLDPNTGPIYLQKQKEFDNELKARDKKIEKLSTNVSMCTEKMCVLKKHLETLQKDCAAKDTRLYEHEMELRETHELLRKEASTKCETQCKMAILREEHASNLKKTVELNAHCEDLDARLVAETARRKEAEHAKKNKECLTSKCTAPSFLVQESGYCIDCEKRKELEDREKELKLQQEQDPPVLLHEALKIGPKGLANALTKHVENVEFVMLALTTIMNLCKQNDAIKVEFALVSGLRAIVEVSMHHATKQEIVIQSCRTIEYLVFKNDQNRTVLMTEGIFKFVLQAMHNFKNVTEVLERCCTTITNLAHNSEYNRRHIIKAKGVESILDIMQRFPSNSTIQLRASWSILTLAGDDEASVYITSIGGIGAIIAAMLNCSADSDVQYYGSWALLNLVSAPDVQKIAKNEGAVDVCEVAIACFPDHAKIHDTAQQVIDILCE